MLNIAVASKAALNFVMGSFAIDAKSIGANVMLIHPVWVRTKMGGNDALIDAQTFVSGILDQADIHFSNSHSADLRRFDGGVIGW
jgi:NAD(P)-dependent dehydrogenase (short-subunit alcohol dehydrogenase family)